MSECKHEWDDDNAVDAYCTKCGLPYWAYEDIQDLRAKLGAAENILKGVD